MKKAKVLAISYLFPNTVNPNYGIFVYNRLNALSKYVDIKVINPIPWSPLHPYIKRYSSLKGVPEKTRLGSLDVYHPRFFSIPKFLKTVEANSYAKAVQRVVDTQLQGFDFDIVDLHWLYPDLPAGVRLSEKYNKPLLATLRGMEAFHINDPGNRKNIIASCLGKTDKVIGLSQELVDTSIDAGADPKKHTVIRNGVDTENFDYMDRDQARKSLGLDFDSPMVVAVGSLIRRKGFDLIINALPEVIRETGNRDIKLYIIGSEGPEGDYRQALFEAVDRAGLKDNVVFQGMVANSDLCTWYNAADIFCLASRGEGSPNVLTEALSCGCPAVATAVGSVPEIMDSEPNIGECVATDDVDAIAAGLKKALKQEYNRQENSERFKRYNWDWCAQNVLEVYESVLPGRSVSG